MSHTSYVPQAGTIPAKVIAHFKTLPPGTELSTSMVLEAIGQPVGWHGLPQCMKLTLESGVMHKRLDRNGWAMWSLVDRSSIVTAKPGQGVDIDRAHAPAAPQPDPQLQDSTAVHDHEPESRAEHAKSADPRLSADERTALRGKAPTEKPEPGPATETGDFECALTNAGRLLINTGTDRVALSPEHTQQLMSYLDEQRGIEWEAA